MNSVARLAHFFSTHPLTRDAQWTAWARFLAWQIRSRLQSEVIIDWIEDQKLAVRRGMTGATGNIYAGLHEFADMMLVLHFLREHDLFLDIGANVGSYTVLAAGVCKADTWAFEPDPDTARALQRNIIINRLQDRVTVHQLALGESDGEASFTIGLDTVNKVIVGDGKESTRRIPIRRLDHLIGNAEPVMIKIDVEGYEERVIRGAGGLLASTGVQVIALETLAPGIEDLFQQQGFRRAYYDPFRRLLSPSPGKLEASNAVFVRDWDHVASRLSAARAIKVWGRLI